MLLTNKNAIVYGAGGKIGGAVARAFAREGARVHLAGRTLATLDAVAADIRRAGGLAETAVVDALDEGAVGQHADAVAARGGSIDVSFSLISQHVVQGTPLVDMRLADLLSPVVTTVSALFITARAAARHMVRQRSGVILAFGGYGDPPRYANVGGLQVAFGAAESLRRNLASELGPHGVRVVTLQTAGVPETIPASVPNRDTFIAQFAERSLLGRAATLEDVGNAAAFAASDWARTMTATQLNITCGAVVD